MALMSCLLRDRLGTYDFRRAIPVDLRPFMPAPWTGKANWTLSLKTKATAKQAGARVLRDCMTDFEAAERAQRGEPAVVARRLSTLPPAEEIEREVLAGLLADDDVACCRFHGHRDWVFHEAGGAWLHRVPSQRTRDDETIGAEVRASFNGSDRTYGARRVWRDVLAEGIDCGLHRIARPMKAQALRAGPRRRGLLKDDGQGSTIAPNTLDREFHAGQPNQRWIADFT